MKQIVIIVALLAFNFAMASYHITGFTETQESFFHPESISSYMGNQTVHGELLEKAGTYCSSGEIEKLVLSGTNERDSFNSLTQRLLECQRKLVPVISGSYIGMAGKLRIDYYYEGNSKFRNLIFKDSNGHVLRAHLGVKDNHPRPLVIFKCGTECNLGASSTREAAISLFDEGPFNILILPNFSSSSYQLDNSALGLAGFDEGLNTLEIAKFVQSSEFPYHNLFSSVHLVGISLGGYATLYTNIYHDAEVKNGHKPFINSFFAQCPVVDLQVSMDRVFEDAVWRRFFIGPFLSRARIIIERVPVLKEIIGEVLDQLDSQPSAQLMSTLAVRYYKNVQSKYGVFPAPFSSMQLNNEGDFWEYSRAQSYTEYLNSPLAVWSSENDPVVDKYKNAEVLKGYVGNREQIGFLDTKSGSHCSPIESYGWAVTGALQRAFIKRHSPELMAKQVTKTFNPQPLKIGRGFILKNNEYRRSLAWRIATGYSQLWLRSEKMEFPCDTGELRKCIVTSESIYNLSDFGINEAPKNEVETLALQRWINANIKPVGSDGQPVQQYGNIHGFVQTDYSFE